MKEDPLSSTATLLDLKTSTVAELRSLYTAIFDVPLQQQVSADFIRGNLAWVIQAHRLKKNPDVLRDDLLKAANCPSSKQTTRYKPGTRLIREWQGETYEVTILEKGYLWQGRKYRSLSRIAQQITGAKWSGPRFFGMLKSKP